MMRMIIKLLVVLSILVALFRFRDVSCQIKKIQNQGSLVGSHMYAMTCTRPDIAYAVSVTLYI